MSLLRAVFVIASALLIASPAPLGAAHAVVPPADRRDWLVDDAGFVAAATREGDRVVLDNGLIRRVIRIVPNAATVAYDNLMTGASELRAVRPEATLTIDGKTYEVGGLAGQESQNFLRAGEDARLTAKAGAFVCTGVTFGCTAARFPWKPSFPEQSAARLPWPPPGVSAVFTYAAPEKLKDVSVEVHYELFDGAPVLSKWIVVKNAGKAALRLGAFKSEILSLADTAPKIDSGKPREWRILGLKAPVPKAVPDAPREYVDRFTQLFVVTDYAMGGDMEAQKDNPGVRWVHDEDYRTGIGYYGQKKPARVECTPPLGPDLDIAPGATWESFRAFELMRDSTDRERRGLAEQRFWALTSPWSRQNPILMHVRSAKPADVRAAVDQCAEVGFEMVVMTFGSGFTVEDTTPAYLATMKSLAEEAKSKGIALGGYSLLASRGGKPDTLAISDLTGQAAGRNDGAKFGATPCLATTWGAGYVATVGRFFAATGMTVFENDGSYPGDLCASTTHAGHRGVADSQWAQWARIRDLYRWCAGNGVYLNVPDWFFLNGQCKTPMGYVENNWSLPRAQQEIIERQNIFDGTWDKSPSMGFMFVPLTQYHGGGAAATIEPLDEHLDHYGTRLANLFGAGVQACYRGPRLYDTARTKALVKRWVAFYKADREILDSPVIHLRRPDGADWDGLLHVNPKLATCAFAMLYNPLETPVTRTVRLPLYYAGITGRASVRIGDDAPVDAVLSRDDSISLRVTIPARGNLPVRIAKTR